MSHRRRARTVLHALISLATASAAAAPALAQQAPFHVQRLNGPVQIDGRSDEAAWQVIEPLPVVSSSPRFNAPPSERTELRMAYDDVYLYVAGRMYDSDVSGIRGPSLRRDESGFNNDWLAINLDPYLDRETALTFGINPSGARTDVVFTGDGAANNFSWNTFWDARVARDDAGWYAEIRIPFSSLRFQERDGVVRMGVTVWRRIARRNEMISWPAIEHRWGTFSIFKASQMAEVVLDGVRRQNAVYVTPYALGGVGRTHRLDNAADAYVAGDHASREAGLDLKYSPTSNLTLDLTLNTDFAQVEADDQQVNLTRFSLFFPERRLFFQERAALFDFGLGGTDQLFYSRRIGLVDGEPVRIYGGLRAVGRAGGWDYGLLDMQTAAAAQAASENAGVVRVRRRLFNENSHVGGLLTSRLGDVRSLAAGSDALVRVTGQDYLSLAVAGTATRGDSTAALDRMFVRAAWERRGIYGLLYAGEVAHVGGDFRPALGFLARRDHARAAARLGYGLRMPQHSWLLRQNVAMELSAYRRYVDDEIETADALIEWLAETRSGRSLTVTARTRYEDLTRAFRIASDVAVPAGDYTFTTVRAAYTPPAGAVLRISANAEAGGYYDGTRASVAVTPTWNASTHVQLSGTYQLNRLSFETRAAQLTTHIARLRALIMASSRMSGTGLVQYNSTTDAALLNVRIRYNPRDGNDLYVVYNHGLNTNRFDYEPARPLTDNATLLLKYSHTLQF